MTDRAPLNAPDAALLEKISALLGPQGVKRPEDAPGFLEEPRGRWEGKAAVIARPAGTEEVSALVKLCAGARVGIVPWSGGTGLVLGQIVKDGPAPVLLSLDRMTRIRESLPDEDALIVDAGVTLADAQKAAEAAGRLFPLSLASEGSCRIGGNLATNAGGVQVLRYGNARDLCLGVEAVLPDGSVLHGLKTLRKDNTGYDLRHLLIGSEGTLGIITGAALKLVPRPEESATAFCAVPGPEAALALLHHLRARFGETVSAFELMSRQGFAFEAEHCPEVQLPIETPDWAVLAEVSGAAGAQMQERLESALEEAMEAELVLDAALANSLAQREKMWMVREMLPEANRRVGAVSSHDVSVPLTRIAGFIEVVTAAIAGIDPGLRVNCFGHLGDGNLHYNVFPAQGRSRGDYADQREAIKRCVHDLVHQMGGSHSAEHGVGRLKTEDLKRYSDPAKLSAMRAIKAALDPLGIMNPGAVLD
ncbi:FAD-binding oxidoreductase [Rhodovulum sp. DZ06]|uniref:FAD-binding oxidoreductase n=1 Tax=Rhodovulum sp. DZ06 TaxID=3425126 RepID=UPI003D349838